MMKLLIAEDDMTSRVLLENLTRKWGWQPVVVEDGEAAWEVLQQDTAPRLLLIDWEMPRLNGLALCQRIRKQPDTDPAYIILLTSRNQTIDIVTGLEEGANDYVTKPFNNVELQARVQVGKRMLGLQQELNQAKEMLAFQASHDVLTGLLNRRAIMVALDKELSRSYRQQQSLCVVMCDIDFFKKINDNYGHLAGDYVIREVTQRISSELRPYDLVGRYGGEEFLLVFNASLQDAFKLLERIRLSIASMPFNYEKEILKVTISSGVTVYDSFDKEGNKQVLIDAADKALYEAKENGRNRVVVG
jgi:diguanylate cyclase (GGDEF)-like protein